MNDDIQIGDFVIFNKDWAEASKDVPPLYNIKKGVVERRELRVVVEVKGNIIGLSLPTKLNGAVRFIPYRAEKKYLTLIESP